MRAPNSRKVVRHSLGSLLIGLLLLSDPWLFESLVPRLFTKEIIIGLLVIRV